MPPEPLSPAAFAFIAQVDEAYATLMQAAQPEPHLGGKLFYAGALTEPACAATVAANIAGAATLAASDDHPAAKQAMRAGQVDFLVNSLDEALRILKNEIRKRETVAVCVTAAPESLEREMQERGVQPDLFFSEFATKMPHEESAGKWLTWRSAQSPALWLPKLDVIALDCLPSEAAATRRWLQRAPRYLGRIAQNQRILHTTESIANQLVAQFKARIAAAEITVPIEIEQGPWGNSHHESLVPKSPVPGP